MAPKDEKLRVGVVSYGALGKCIAKAVHKCKDMELVGVFTRRNPKLFNSGFTKFYAYDSAKEFTDRIDVMILTNAPFSGLYETGTHLASMFNTVDMFPLRGNPPSEEQVAQQRAQYAQMLEAAQLRRGQQDEAEAQNSGQNVLTFGLKPTFQPVYPVFGQYFEVLNKVAQDSGHYAISAAGWEPGVFSAMRVMLEALIPGSKTHTFWGRGISINFSNAIRNFEGVLDAVVYQVPKADPLEKILANEFVLDESRRALHYMECYVVTDGTMDHELLREEIAKMPGWFEDYDTQVTFLTPDEMREFHNKTPHAGLVITRASTSQGVNHQLKMEIDMDDNHEFTGYVVTAIARAAYRAQQAGWKGAGTLLDVPLSWLSPIDDHVLRNLTSPS